MAYSAIVITQSSVSGASGVSREDLTLSNVVTLTNDSDGDLGVTAWEWVMLEAPPGSTATLSGQLTSTASFTPDVAGRYVVGLRINGLGDSTRGYGRTVCGARYDSLGTAVDGGNLGDWLLPAAAEGFISNWGGNTKGAQPELWRVLDQLRNDVLPGVGGGASTLPNPYDAGHQVMFPIALPGQLTQSTNSSSYVVAGYTPLIDASDYQSHGYASVLWCIGRNGSAGTAYVRLYDVTNGVVVTDSEETTTSSIEDSVVELTVGSISGTFRSDGDTRYAVEIMHDPGAGVDLAEIYGAYLFLSTVALPGGA